MITAGPRLVIAIFVGWGFVATPVVAQEWCEWSLEETLRIGSIDGPDALSPVAALDVGPEGGVYLAQNFVTEVWVFGPDGEVSGTIGRAGQGPGEFTLTLLDLGWRADTLWVSDFGGTYFFDRHGAPERQVRFDVFVPDESGRFTPRVPLADGTFLAERAVAGDIGGFFSRDRLPILRFSPEGEIVDTLAVVDSEPSVQVGTGFARHPLAQGITPDVAPTPDGSAVVLVGEVREEDGSASFDLLRLGIDGDTLVQRSIPYEPRPITQDERDLFTEAFIEGRSDPQAARDAITFPEYHRPVRRIVAGHDDSIWLLRELDLANRVDLWEVYDAAGELEGRVKVRQGETRGDRAPWSQRLDLLRATRDEAWGVTADEFDVPYLHRFRVHRDC